MNIHFNLVYPNRDESPLRVVVTHRGKVYRKSVGLTLPTKSWNGKKCGNAKVDNALRRIRIGLESLLDDFSTDKAISEALGHISEGDWHDDAVAPLNARNTPSFWSYFDEWCNRENPAKRQRRNTYTLVGKLMGTSDNWEDIDSAWYFRLIQRMNDADYSKNYQGSVVAKIKTVMSEGEKLKYHRNTEYKDFKRPSNEVDSVYLTREELDAVWNLELKDSLEKKARDMLIIGCYTGARWEDYSQFSKENIDGRTFRYIQRKTGARVSFPVAPRLKDALKRNGWHSPLIGDVVFNRIVKTVCMKAGINTPVQVRRSKGEGYEHDTVPKWKMVSSHTCRRTMCTLLDREGVPLKQIMSVSGHKSLVSLQKYLRQSESDNAEIFGRVDFFK